MHDQLRRRRIEFNIPGFEARQGDLHLIGTVFFGELRRWPTEKLVLGPQRVVQLVPNFPTTFLEQIKSTVLNRIEAFCDFSEDG